VNGHGGPVAGFGFAALVLAALLSTSRSPAVAAEVTTRCSFGGPTGNSRVLRLDLPEGSDFLTVSLSGTRATRPAGTTDSWHLATGAFVIDEATSRLVSSRISSEGTATRRTVVENGGSRPVDAATPGPDAPFRHAAIASAPRLAPGSYLVVAFGSDGSSTTPNDSWGGFVEVAGSHACSLLPSGTVFDVNHNDFSGGTQVSTTAASMIMGASLTRDLSGDIVVGLMDASTQVTGNATLDYSMPNATSGTVSDAIVPFVAPGGAYAWTANASGVAPIISIAAVVIDLPA
jgi:hypothetical protein